MVVPDFPSPSVIQRIQGLGYGSGPWSRETLVRWLGEANAEKFITEAKSKGWLISPYRGTFYVPAAQDLAVVSWLPEPARTEFLVSRTLVAADIPYWCLSAWCREEGLEFNQAVFVTDLDLRSSPVNTNDRKALWAEARKRAGSQRPLPFLENLVIVPRMPPPSDEVQVRVTLVPEVEAVPLRRQKERMTGQAAEGIAGLVGLGASLLMDKVPEKLPDAMFSASGELESMERRARGVSYAVGPAISDRAWIIALLACLGTPRIEEMIERLLRDASQEEKDAVIRWAAWFGPPQPNAGWKEAIPKGPFPYLFVPPVLWAEMGADQAARRFRMLQRLGD
jgi:hypothetical protein